MAAMSKNIPCVLMRGGTSRGPFFLSDWLPSDPAERDRALLAAMGSPHELQIDGLGGGNSLTSKVAIVSRSHLPDCDVDYLFAQVSVERAKVDVSPNCGNMLAAVGPFAIERGLVRARRDGTTRVRIFNINTRSRIDAIIDTPSGCVRYDGDVSIDGVPGTAAPILLSFLDVWGSVTGRVFPTGQRSEIIDGVDVSCVDAAQVMVLIRSACLGLTAAERPEALDGDTELSARLERIRLEAGRRMGLGDVSQGVLPKPVLVAPGPRAGTVLSRYFTPHRCHRSHAATGAIGVAAMSVLPGTVISAAPSCPGTHHVAVLHPAGKIDVQVEATQQHGQLNLQSASLVRTARKILEGTLFLPD